MLLDQFLQAREFFGREMFRFHQAHDETLRRAAKETIDHVADVFADHLLATDGRFIKIRAVLESAFRLPFSFEYVEHGLNGGVSEVALQFLLDGLNVCGTRFPQHVHNLQFQRGQMLSLRTRHLLSPKFLGV